MLQKIQALLFHRVLGILIFLTLMWGVFQFIFTIGSYPMGWIDSGIVWLSEYCQSVMSEGILRSVLVDGIIAGVGATLLFVPQVVLLFLALAVLKKSGYLHRAALLFDKFMRVLGVSGHSFVPLLMGFGCNVPAIMAAATLPKEKERIITILLIPFMSCSARLPVYTLLIAAFFHQNWQGTILFGLYTFGILLAILAGLLLRRYVPEHGSAKACDVPEHELSWSQTFQLIFHQVNHFLARIGRVIVPLTIVFWVLFSFPTGPIEDSFAARIGQAIQPIFAPLGFDWRMTTGLISGFIAKESFVGTLGTLYAVESTDTASLIARLETSPILDATGALALMVFVLLYQPCVATLLAIRYALGQKYFYLASILPTLIAWVAAFLVYQIGSILK
jgi:ferrous iron transport protein B